jgi:DNA helicase TIP49 (TBP-interacting protein)
MEVKEVPIKSSQANLYLKDIENHIESILESNEIQGIYGDACLASIAAKDVARCVAGIVTSKVAQHAGQGYTLTGPESITRHELCQKLTSLLGQRITYHNMSDAQFFKQEHERLSQTTNLMENAVVLARDRVYYQQCCRRKLTGADWSNGNVEILTASKACSWEDFLKEKEPLFKQVGCDV